ncbi:hypothetical protein RYX36_023058 [Vicia faba]
MWAKFVKRRRRGLDWFKVGRFWWCSAAGAIFGVAEHHRFLGFFRSIHQSTVLTRVLPWTPLRELLLL